MERSQDSVRVDAEFRCQVSCLGNLLPGHRLAVCDSSSNLRRDLFVQENRFASVDSSEIEIARRFGVAVDRAHKNNDSSFMETMEAPRLIPTSAAFPDAEALFKEAQRHRRNRRLFRSGIVVVVLSLAVLLGLVVAGSGGRTLPVIPVTQPAFANTVTNATIRAKGASFTFIERLPPSTCGNTEPQTIRQQGSIDFVSRRMQYSTLESACPNYGEPLTILTATARYLHTGSNVAPGIETTEKKPWLKFPSSPRSPSFSVANVMLAPDIGALLRGLTGPLARRPSTPIAGVSSTEYRGTTTLAALERGDPTFIKIQPESVLPDAASIDVPFEIWVDKLGRVTRVAASEPSFHTVYADGYTETGPQVSAFGIPEATATGPRQIGVTSLSITFSGFGPKAIAIPPPHSTVVTG
jgi:hypothetical protein